MDCIEINKPLWEFEEDCELLNINKGQKIIFAQNDRIIPMSNCGIFYRSIKYKPEDFEQILSKVKSVGNIKLKAHFYLEYEE